MYRRLPLVLLSVLSLRGADPAAAQVAVLGGTVQERTVRAGDSYGGTVLVFNPSAQTQTARVYQTDYRYFADGRSLFDAPGTTERSNAKWISPAVSQVSVPPGGTVPVHYTVRVPQDSALVGTFWSMLMVEGSPLASDRPRPAEDAVGLVPVIRYGIQIVSHLERAGARRVEFSGLRVTEAEGAARVLEFEIRNTGESAFRPEVTVELFDADGEPAGTLREKRGLLYPGTSLLQRFDLSGLAPQTYQALIIADTGEEDVFGAQYTLRL